MLTAVTKVLCSADKTAVSKAGYSATVKAVTWVAQKAEWWAALKAMRTVGRLVALSADSLELQMVHSTVDQRAAQKAVKWAGLLGS